MGSAGALQRFAAAAVIAVLAAGCHGEKKKVPPPEPVLGAVTVLTPEADVQAAHALEVELELSSNRAVEAVGVAYRAFPRAQWDAHAEDMVSWVLGTSTHDVPAGSATFTAQLELPYDVPAGDYYLVGEVDPLDTIAEANEENQLGEPVPFVVRDERRDEVRLMLAEGHLDTPAFELSFVTTDTPPEPLGLSLVATAEAAAAVEGARISACLRAPGLDCASLPLGIWVGTATEGAFGAALPLPALVPGDPTSLHVDLRIGPELEADLGAFERMVAEACLDDLAACVATYGLRDGAADCVGATSPEHPDFLTLEACLLKLVPFAIEATIDDPDVVLYDPPGASPGRTESVALQLTAAPPVTPVVPTPLTVRALRDPIFHAEGGDFPKCDQESLDLVADRGACAEPVVWSAQTLEGYSAPWPVGTVTGADTTASYSPYHWIDLECGDEPWCYYSCVNPGNRDEGLIHKVKVTATACGQTASLVLFEQHGAGVAVAPPRVDVLAGAPGTVDFKALLSTCLGATDTTWSLVEASDGTLGTLEATATPWVVKYRAPVLPPGAGATVTVHAASAACGFAGDATIRITTATTIGFEKTYTKWFGGDLFGAGIDLYGGASVNAQGASASAHAIVPLKVFGADVNLFKAEDVALVDPRTGGTSTFDHGIEVFGYSVNALHCPGDPMCTGEWQPWSESKCVPEGKPPVCVGTPYATACKTTTDCVKAGLAGMSCKNKLCTKKCDEPSDCPNGVCEGTLQPGPYKRTFLIVVIPVTVEGKVCAELGVQASLNLLEPDHDQLALKVGPYFEVNGYASAAVGYTGILAVGVRGELVLVRDEFYGEASATLAVVEQGQLGCLLPRGCLQATFRESINNVLNGGQGLVYLFADYPTLRWCGWYPCFGTARAKKTLASWGPLFEVENRCDFCVTDADCDAGVSCVDGECLDGGRGILCRQQSCFMTAAE